MPSFTQTEKQGGQTEIRQVTVCSQPKWIENQTHWKDLNTVVMVDRTRQYIGEEQNSKLFYISSLVNPTP